MLVINSQFKNSNSSNCVFSYLSKAITCSTHIAYRSFIVYVHKIESRWPNYDPVLCKWISSFCILNEIEKTKNQLTAFDWCIINNRIGKCSLFVELNVNYMYITASRRDFVEPLTVSQIIIINSIIHKVIEW